MRRELTKLQHEADDDKQDGGQEIHAEQVQPEYNADKTAQKEIEGNPRTEQAVAFLNHLTTAKDGQEKESQVIAGQPENKQEEDGKGAHHLHLFHPRDDRPKGGAQSRRRQTPAERLEQAGKQPAEDEKAP